MKLLKENTVAAAPHRKQSCAFPSQLYRNSLDGDSWCDVVEAIVDHSKWFQ